MNIDELTKLPRDERIKVIELMTEQRDFLPHQLDEFADAILHEDLVDDHPDKMTRDEYPIMSERQLMRRHQKETGLKNAEEYDTNGRNRGKPVRRRRSKYENTLVDLRARSRNKERHRKYAEFTKKQPVKRYFLPK